MITNEHMETLPSSCSSTSSSCSSSASSTNSSSISTLSSTQGTASSSSNSTSSSPSTSNHHHHNKSSNQASFLNKQEQLAFDFHIIMNDLKNVCGTLNVLARQIDQIVNKMDDKFNLIVENLNIQQENESAKSTVNTNQRNKTTTKLSDLIKCANLGSNNEPIYSNNSLTSKLSSNSGSLFYSNASTKSKSKSNYSNPNEALLTSLINENYAAILNTQALNKGSVSRTFSDRKPLYFTAHAINEEMKKNFNLSFKQDSEQQQQQQPKNNLFQKQSTSNNNQTSLNKTRCIRSKSQPAFAKPENIDYHSFLLSNSNNDSSKTITSTKNIDSNTTQEETNKTNESSYYEDQLDNELEGFENSSKLLLTNLSNKFKKDDRPPVNSTPSSTTTSTTTSSSTTTTINSIINNSNNTNISNSITEQSTAKAMTPNLKQAGRTKSSNSNHHVSFNLNNAIYSSRQETPVPIPISILKNSTNNVQAKLLNSNITSTTTTSDKNDSKYANLSNGPLNLLSFPSSLQSATTSITNSPMQVTAAAAAASALKKQMYANPATFLISEQQQQNIQQLASVGSSTDDPKINQPLRSLLTTNSNSNLNTNSTNKTVRIDSKTTIL